jgi:toxin ParE1/3/4
MSADRSAIAPGLRRLRIESARRAIEGPPVRAAPHVLFYRVAENGRVEVLRVLHGRMEPRRHLRE